MKCNKYFKNPCTSRNLCVTQGKKSAGLQRGVNMRFIQSSPEPWGILVSLQELCPWWSSQGVKVSVYRYVCVKRLYILVTKQSMQTALIKSLFSQNTCLLPGQCHKELTLLRIPHSLKGTAFPSLCLCCNMLGVFYLFSFLAILPLLGQTL